MCRATSRADIRTPNAITDLGSISIPVSASKYCTRPPCEEGIWTWLSFAIVGVETKNFKKVKTGQRYIPLKSKGKNRLEAVVSPILFL